MSQTLLVAARGCSLDSIPGHADRIHATGALDETPDSDCCNCVPVRPHDSV